MEANQSPAKRMAIRRIRFFLEVAIVFLGIFLFMLIPRFLLIFLLDDSNVLFGPIYFVLRALIVVLAIPIFLLVADIILESQKKELIIEEDISPAVGYLRLYRFNKKNIKWQLLYGVLLFLLIFVPLDFFTYLFIPQLIEYGAVSLSSDSLNSYLLQSYALFLVSVIIIQISVSVYEEGLIRGFLTKRGSEHLNNMSAVIISSVTFGLMHFAYYFDPISRNYPFWFPLIWFLQSFFIGVILSIVVIRKKWLLPAIIAHALNNIISAHMLWNYLQGNEFLPFALFIYIPLFIAGVGLFLWKSPLIKESLNNGIGDFMLYFKPNKEIEETQSDIMLRIGIDAFMAFILFFLALLVS